MRRSLIVGNWKMHGSRADIDSLLQGIKGGVDEVASKADIAVCPPAVYIDQVAASLAGTGVEWGAQNVSDQPQGALTGEISADMLVDLDCRYVIVGHSERRTLLGEDDALVAAKVDAALEQGLVPILCVGETLAQREAGETLALIERQRGAVLDVTGVAVFSRAVVAYEPIWAIGTGKTATPDQAQAVHAHIRSVLATRDRAVADSVPLLYGGSVKPDNAAELFAQMDIDGALVGGASLHAGDFLAIVNAA